MSRGDRPDGTAGPPPLFVFAYGVLGYLCFLVSAALLTWHLRPHESPSLDDSSPIAPRLLVNVALLFALYVPHSVMARPSFKRWWTRVVPETIERSTYVWVSSLLVIALVTGWQSVPGELWRVENVSGQIPIYFGTAAAIALLVVSSRATRAWDLFGLRRVWCTFRGRAFEPPAEFTEHRLYRVIRHPMMVGLLLLLWCAPVMTIDRFTFIVVSTVYIAIGTYLEERDLLSIHGERYREYRREVPAFVPKLRSHG